MEPRSFKPSVCSLEAGCPSPDRSLRLGQVCALQHMIQAGLRGLMVLLVISSTLTTHGEFKAWLPAGEIGHTKLVRALHSMRCFYKLVLLRRGRSRLVPRLFYWQSALLQSVRCSSRIICA